MSRQNLPSSPPSNAIDEVELPPVPPRPVFTRKRTRSITSLDTPTASSDPALFSSDEQTPSVEDYVFHKRRKRLYPGTWWGERSRKGNASAPTRRSAKNAWKRNLDSGIFMASDESSNPSSDGFLEEELVEDLKTKAQETARRDHKIPSIHVPGPLDLTRHQHATVVKLLVTAKIENGEEDIDLSNMDLVTLPDEVLQLRTLTKSPHLVAGMLETGVSLETHLRLYLSNNLLTRVPTQIAQLTNLRTLSLRNNKLKTIPHGFRNLVNLQSLNISGNNLEFLPYELINLTDEHSLDHILLSPNPFMSFQEARKDRLNMTELTDYHSKRGKESSRNWMWYGDITKLDPSFTHGQQSGACSLSESVLRQLVRLGAPPKLAAQMPPGTAENVTQRLDVLEEAQDDERRCTWCQRNIVVPEKRWVEWWFPRLDEDGFSQGIPFLRLSCGKCGLGYLKYATEDSPRSHKEFFRMINI